MENKYHEFQMTILRELLFNPGARFRDLNKVDVTNDHFTFHVNKLLKEGFILKRNSKYFLTTAGKEFANRMDTEVLKLERQAKLAVAIHAVRKYKGEVQYLIHQRLKEPFFGWYGSHSGKIRWGEDPLTCAKREFLEETGLTGKFKLKGILHYHHFYKNGKLLEDKYFWVFRVYGVKGKLKKKVPEGRNIWMNEGRYRKLTHVFGSFEEMEEITQTKELLYIDLVKFVDSY